MSVILSIARAVLMGLGVMSAAEMALPGDLPIAPGAATPRDIPLIGGLFPRAGVSRRRRRKALSDADMRTALTIASAISKKAAETFIQQRVRRG